MKTLSEIRQYLNTIPNINEGGCLISAYAIYSYFKMNNSLPKDFKIVEVDDDTLVHYMGVMQYMSEDPNSNVTSCGHAVVLYEGFIYDSNTEIKMEDCVDVMVNGVWVDPKDHEQWLINQINFAGWNPKFNREKHVPQIEKELGVDLSVVKLTFTKEEKKMSDAAMQATHDRLVKAKAKYEKEYPDEFNNVNFSNVLAQLGIPAGMED